MKHLIACLTLVACGGQPFEGDLFTDVPHSRAGAAPVAAAGSAGESQAGAGGSATATAGAPSAAGTSGSAQGGSGAEAGSGESGEGGAAGSDSSPCGEIPDRSTWVPTTSSFYPQNPPELALDGDPMTNFTSNTEQLGQEWYEIDFGKSVTITEVTLLSNFAEYTHGYKITMSDKHLDLEASAVAEGQGHQGKIVVQLEAPASGQYLVIHQTAEARPWWWGVSEISVACE